MPSQPKPIPERGSDRFRLEYDHVSGRLPVDRQDVELIVADRAVVGHQIAAHFGVANRQIEAGELPRMGSAPRPATQKMVGLAVERTIPARPREANRSSCGVWLTRFPSQPISP